MSETDRIEQLRQTIQEEEKRFLMDRYVSMLMAHVEESAPEELDDRTVESLLVSRAYVSKTLATAVGDFLENAGYEVEDIEAEDDDDDLSDHKESGDSDHQDSGNGHSENGETAEDFDTAVEDEDFAALLDGEDVTEDDVLDTDEGETSQSSEVADRSTEADLDIDSLETADETASDTIDESVDTTSLFDDEEADPSLAASDDKPATGDETTTAGSSSEDLGDLDGEGLFDDDGSELQESGAADPDAPEGDDAGVTEATLDLEDAEETDEVGLFDDEAEEPGEKKRGTRPGKSEKKAEGKEDAEDSEEDESAGVLFDQDIYSGNEGDAANGADADASEETPGFTASEGHEVEETPGFTASEGHEIEETPGFTASVGYEVKETPGFTPTEGHEAEETPGFTPTKGHEVEETPGFTPTKGVDNRKKKKRGPGFTVGETDDESAGPPGDAADDGEDDGKPGKGAKKGSKGDRGEEKSRRFLSPEERAERIKKAAEERRERVRKQKQPQAQEEPEGEAEELDLDLLTHQVSLDDIEQYLDMSVLPDDRQKLDRRWQQKIRDPSIRQLLTNQKAMDHPYALVPRLPRFFKGGAAVQANMLNLVRNYPQLFDNVAGLINKYRTQPLFLGETPELDWAIVACEALPTSLNRNYMEQKTVIKQYSQENQTNERRISRRRLIEILYDCIVINVITKEQILNKTVDLSDSRVGKQNFACVNYGEKGIRIYDVSRQQRNPQMGMCPSW